MRNPVTRHPTTRLVATLAVALLLAGCAGGKGGQQNTLFDFGSPAVQDLATDPPAPLAALVVTDVTGPAALDSERMYYRLNYADQMQARTYANSRWSANPLHMVTQRFKARIAQSGVKVLSVTDAANGVPILRVEIDDFVHAFASASQSHGQVMLRASLFQGHDLVDQKTFSRVTPASTADAAGGARALAASTDAVAADIVAWLRTVNLPKPATTLTRR
jgi:cholesterol transport system auxiliary component